MKNLNAKELLAVQTQLEILRAYKKLGDERAAVEDHPAFRQVDEHDKLIHVMATNAILEIITILARELTTYHIHILADEIVRILDGEQ